MTPKKDGYGYVRFRGSPEPNNNRSSRSDGDNPTVDTKPESLPETSPAIHPALSIGSDRNGTIVSDGANADNLAARSVVLQRLHYLPLLGLTVGVLSIFTPYGFAVYRGDVPAWLPYISDAGGDPPQSAIFSMGMTLIGLMFCVGIYLCYLVLEAQNVKDSKLISWLGKLLVLSGFAMCVGLFGVATNPTGHLRRDGDWAWVVLVPHLLGAALFFGAGIGMMLMMTYITFLIDRPNYLNKLFIARASIMMGSLLGGLLVLVGLPSIHEIDTLKPSPDHGRIYPAGTAWSAFGEWLIVIMFMGFVTTFIPVFARTKITLVVDYKK